jgi:hypothetical protein
MMVFAVGRDAMLERNRRSQPPFSDTATPKALATLLGGGGVDTFKPSSGLPWSGRAGYEGRFATGKPSSTATGSVTPTLDTSLLPPHARRGIDKYGNAIQQAARKNGIAPSLLAALIDQESGFNPNAVNPNSKATGLCQFMAGTAPEVGIRDRRDPNQSIKGGALYLARMINMFGGDVERGLAAYNAGPGTVQRAKNRIPNIPETRKYVKIILANQKNYQAAGFDLEAPSNNEIAQK